MEENKGFIKDVGNQLIVLFFGYYLLKNIFRESEAIFSGIFMIIFIFIVIKSEFINKKQEKVNISIEDNLKLSKKEIIKIYVKKELIKIVLINFLLISPMIFNLSVAWYGSLIEYLKHGTLRLFTDFYYLNTALGSGHPINEYFRYITEELHITNLYLWIIPFCMGIIHMYIAYWIVHKIVDRSGVGATKRLNFVYFFFIFGISNILSRLFAYEVFKPITGVHILYVFWWYIFYKIIKIGVLKIEEKLKRGE